MILMFNENNTTQRQITGSISGDEMSKKAFLILLIALLAVGCNSDSRNEEAKQGPVPQVFVFPGPQKERLISQEIIDQDNCDGTAETSQTVERSHTVFYTLELGSNIKVEADGRAKIPEIGEVGVGVEVAGNYQVGYGNSDSISRSQTVAAAPRSHIQHTVQQFEIWETGEVLIVAGGINQRFLYNFRRDFSIKAVAPANVDCPEGGASQSQPEAEVEIPNETIVSPIPQRPIKERTITTGGGVTEVYAMNLENGEILVGHADGFKEYYGCIAYLIVGPGDFEFSLTSGLWDLWSNVPPDQYETLLNEQGSALTNLYGCTPVKFVRCDSQGCQQ